MLNNMTNLDFKKILTQFLILVIPITLIVFAGYGLDFFVDFKKIILLITLPLLATIINIKFKNFFSLPVIIICLFLLAIFTYIMTKNHDLFTSIYRWILFGIIAVVGIKRSLKLKDSGI